VVEGGTLHLLEILFYLELIIPAVVEVLMVEVGVEQEMAAVAL
jgi:hypothetical protein